MDGNYERLILADNPLEDPEITTDTSSVAKAYRDIGLNGLAEKHTRQSQQQAQADAMKARGFSLITGVVQTALTLGADDVNTGRYYSIYGGKCEHMPANDFEGLDFPLEFEAEYGQLVQSGLFRKFHVLKLTRAGRQELFMCGATSPDSLDQLYLLYRWWDNPDGAAPVLGFNDELMELASQVQAANEHNAIARQERSLYVKQLDQYNNYRWGSALRSRWMSRAACLGYDAAAGASAAGVGVMASGSWWFALAAIPGAGITALGTRFARWGAYRLATNGEFMYDNLGNRKPAKVYYGPRPKPIKPQVELIDVEPLVNQIRG